MPWDTLSAGLAQARREMAAREQRDIEQKEIADAIGVTTAAYSRWERGEREPKDPVVKALAKFFGVTPAYLRYGISPAGLPDALLANARKLTEAELDRADEISARAEPAAKRAKPTPRKPKDRGKSA